MSKKKCLKQKYMNKPKTTRKEINDPKPPKRVCKVTKPIIKSMFSKK